MCVQPAEPLEGALPGEEWPEWGRPEASAVHALCEGAALRLHSSALYHEVQQPVLQMAQFAGVLDLPTACDTIVAACTRAARAHDGALWAVVGQRQLQRLPLRDATVSAKDGIMGQALLGKRAVVATAPSAALAIPLLLHSGEAVAVLQLGKGGEVEGEGIEARAAQFAEEDVHALAALTTEAAVTLRHAEMHARFLKADAHSRRLHGLVASTHGLAADGGPEPPELLPRMGAELFERIPCQQLGVLRLHLGTLQTAYRTSDKLMFSADTYEFVLQLGRTLRVHKDQLQQEQLVGCPKDVYQCGSAMLLPIPSINGEPLGVLQLVNRQFASRFDDHDALVAEAFAANCGCAISLQAARAEAAKAKKKGKGALNAAKSAARLFS